MNAPLAQIIGSASPRYNLSISSTWDLEVKVVYKNAVHMDYTWRGIVGIEFLRYWTQRSGDWWVRI